MDLGPFYIDLKEVPLHVSEEQILACLQVFEEVGGVGALQSNGNRTGAASAGVKSEVFILRVHEIISHGYETRPDTKVLRTLWSSRREPQALAQVACLALDGHSMPLCRFGQDVCSQCFDPKHRTSACARAQERNAAAHAKRRVRASKKIARRNSGSSSSSSSNEGFSLTKSSTSMNSATSVATTSSSPSAATSPTTRHRVVKMTSALTPVLFESYSHRAGEVQKASLNGRFNTASVVKSLGPAVDPSQQGKMATRGVYALPTVTALELSNGMSETTQGTRRFHDLNTYSAMASSLLNEKLALPSSKPLQPAPSLFRRNAAALLAKQHGDFDDLPDLPSLLPSPV